VSDAVERQRFNGYGLKWPSILETHSHVDSVGLTCRLTGERSESG
jgi:hypothetical protein